MLKVVIIGYGEMLSNVIAGTLDSGSKIVGVFRHDRIKLSKPVLFLKDMISPEQEYNYIKSYKLPEIKSNSVNSEDFRKKLLKLNPDIMIVASWSEKIDKKTFDIPKIATINVHPSLLPKYRGPNPYMQTILHCEEKSGVTFHLMDERFDAGAILDQRTVEISPSDTGKELKAKTVLTARGAICELLEKLSEDVIFPVAQNESKASYYSTDFDNEIRFNQSANEISAKIRCIHPWSYTYFFLDKYVFVPNPYKITIMENTTPCDIIGGLVEIDANDKSITVVSGDGKLVRLAGLKLYGAINQFFTKRVLTKLQKIYGK